MPSIILAGTTSGTALSLTSDTSGELQIQTNNGATTAMTLTTGGNVGIGVNPVSQNGKVLQIDGGATAADLRLTNNATGAAANNGILLGLAGSDAYLYNFENAFMAFGTNGAERMRIPAAGGLQVVNCVSVGNATPSASGAGITFPATQSASSDANTLDDYEEGTWTPIFGGSTTDPTSVSYSAQTGTYTKIGRQITIGFDLIFSTYSGGSGNAYIKGLPFNSVGSVNQQQGALVVEIVTFTAGRTAVVSAISQGSNFLRMFQYGSAVAYSDTTLAQVPSSATNKYIQGTITYFTA